MDSSSSSSTYETAKASTSVKNTHASRTPTNSYSLLNNNSSSLYDSALDHIDSDTTCDSSIENSGGDSSTSTLTERGSSTPRSSPNSGNDTPNENGHSSTFSLGPTTSSPIAAGASGSMRLLQAERNESTETNTSQEEVDPKSQLANKTIFKSANPNLSIIEINENSIKEQDLRNSVVLIETASDDEKDTSATTPMGKVKAKHKKSPVKLANENGAVVATTSTADKRRKRAESLIQSSKQKLDIAIAEASAAADAGGSDGDHCAVVAEAPAGEPQPDTKREIKLYDTIEEFEQNLPTTVSVLETPFGSKVYLVGTAHFSEESQDDVSFVIRNVRPDVVMVELCPSRIHILKLDEKTLLEEAKNFTIAKIRGIIQAHGYINGIFFILLLQMSAQIAKDLGMAPGGEFRRAFEEIHKLPGCILHLGDRPIRITLHRALRALSLWQTIKLVWRLTSTESISIEEVEECKQRDLLEKLMEEMAGEFPAFSDVFVRERDLFLCHSLQLAALPQAPPGGSSEPRPVRVVGVVGIGHAKGIAKMWGRVDPQKIPAILEIPPASLSTRICKYTLKYGFIGLTLLVSYKVLRPRLMRFF